MTMLLTTIPFSGFYSSIHDSELDWTLEQMFSDYNTGCDINSELLDRAYDAVKWGQVHKEYTENYVEAFQGEFNIPSMEFDALDSPREYNYTTDRIFVKVSRDDIARIWKRLDKAILTTICNNKFTHSSGFISSYSPDWKKWGRITNWDHNQLGALMSAIAEQDSSSYSVYASDPDAGHCFNKNEFELMEYARCNGVLDNMLSEGSEMSRLLNIHTYLNVRSDREVKV